MGMRTQCKHYFRRTTPAGGVVESCALDAAPDAPETCPADCVYFEKRKLATAGFDYGSLAPEPPAIDEPEETPDDASHAALDDVKALFDEIGDDVVRDENAKKSKSRRKKFRRKKR